MANKLNRLDRLEKLQAEHDNETGFSDSGIPLDFRVAGKQKHAVFAELAGYIEARLRGSDLSPERRQELESKVAHLTASAERHRQPRLGERDRFSRQ